jgi:hypothetical protein
MVNRGIISIKRLLRDLDRLGTEKDREELIAAFDIMAEGEAVPQIPQCICYDEICGKIFYCAPDGSFMFQNKLFEYIWRTKRTEVLKIKT